MRSSGLVELDAVLAVARHRNFRAAAAELDMSPSALSHAVAALEARLEVRLFNRTTRSVSLTEAGAQFVGRVAPALSDIRSAMEAAGQPSRDAVGHAAAQHVGGRGASDHGADRPGISAPLSGHEGRYRHRGAAGRHRRRRASTPASAWPRLVPQDMIAVPIGPELRFAVVGSPGYFAAAWPRRARPRTCSQHRCIRTRLPSGGIYRWEFERHGEEIEIDVQGPLTLDESNLMLEAAEAGVGIAYLTEFNVAAGMKAGRLERVLEDWTPAFPGLCLYYPGRRHVPAGLRALIELIREVRV